MSDQTGGTGSAGKWNHRAETARGTLRELDAGKNRLSRPPQKKFCNWHFYYQVLDHRIFKPFQMLMTLYSFGYARQ